jgi:MFS transporter, MHS family, proline/betaine transporter
MRQEAAVVALEAERISERRIITAAVASSLGWALDLFDLFILLYVAPVVGRLFFPSSYPTLSLAAVYASFAVTLLMRPVGAAVFGSYADRYGRRGAMIVAVTGAGISTALFGALPTIQQVGVAAPLSFLFLRLVQGIFVGGVVASTHTIGTETVPARWRGAMSGLVGGGGSGIGALIASIVYLIAAAIFSGPAFDVWGWRCMFFAGIMSSVLGFFIFRSLEESPFFAELQKARAQRPQARHAPVRTLFSREWIGVFAANLMITIGAGAGYYLTSGYLPTFLKVVNKVPDTSAAVILIIASIVAIVTSVLVGHISNGIGRKPTFLIVGALRLVLLPLLFLFMPGAGSLWAVAGYTLAITFLGNAGNAPVLIFLNERFPTALRATGTGLSWNVGFAIGGMMPTFVSLAAGATQHLPVSLAVFVFAISVLYVAGAIVNPETRGRLA